MRRRRRGEARKITILALTLLGVTVFSMLSHVKFTSAVQQIGAAVDLFTLKAPFDGKGANQSSEGFEPQELVVLGALATYNEGPQCNMLIAFQATGPPNRYQNITIIGSGRTDETGIAEFSFRLPWPCDNAEETIFGIWSAIVTVNIAGQTVVDTLTFQVGWIVKITAFETLSSELASKTAFARNDPIVFNLTVENTALTAKVAAIKIDVQDSHGYPIIHIQMDDMLFQPGKTNVKAPSQIPFSAELGLANASAAPFTAPPEKGGTLYSPAIYTTFSIAARDIAVTDIRLSGTSILVGETLTIDVTVVNKGEELATFDLNVFYDSSMIEIRENINLVPLEIGTYTFIWKTSQVDPGFYQISASAPLLGDTNPSDNTYVNGIVEVRSEKPPEGLHDVAVVNVVPSPTLVQSGEIVYINVTVRNKGTTNESFAVTVYHNQAPIDRKYVTDLPQSAEIQLSFKWNTTGAFPMKYVISAVAEKVEGETRLTDNTYIDGTVTISPYPPFFPTSDWLIFWIVVIIAAVIGIVMLIILLFLDRVRRRLPRPTYTIIAHPHI